MQFMDDYNRTMIYKIASVLLEDKQNYRSNFHVHGRNKYTQLIMITTKYAQL